MVQIWVKELHVNVEFKVLFPIMKKHLADGDNAPCIFQTYDNGNNCNWGLVETGNDSSVKLSD